MLISQDQKAEIAKLSAFNPTIKKGAIGWALLVETAILNTYIGGNCQRLIDAHTREVARLQSIFPSINIINYK